MVQGHNLRTRYRRLLDEITRAGHKAGVVCYTALPYGSLVLAMYLAAHAVKVRSWKIALEAPWHEDQQFSVLLPFEDMAAIEPVGCT